MNRRISPVLDVQPTNKRPWTALVQVLENGHVQQSRASNDFKRLALTDSQGTKVNAVIYSNHLRFFANQLLPYKRYYISNALIINNDPRYRTSEYEYSWVLNNRTLVEEVSETVPQVLPCTFEFTHFADLVKVADREILQNVKAIVLHCFPSKQHGSENFSTRDIIVVNEEKKPMLLTLWNDFDEKEGNALASMINTGPMIFGMRLKVTTFNFLSLTTRSASGFLINPPVVEELQMSEWYNANKDELNALVTSEAYKNSDILLPPPKEEEIISLSMATSELKNLKTAWVRGQVKLPRQERSMWCLACANCKKTVDADLDWIIKCPSCNRESEVEARARLALLLNDGSANLKVTIFSPDAEKIMPFSAINIKQAEEVGIDLYADIATSVSQHTITAFVRCYESKYQGHIEWKINVVKAYKVEEVLPTPNFLSLPPTNPVTQTTSSDNAAISNVTNDEFFTPTTKKVLHEVASTLVPPETFSISNNPAKRSLFLHEDLPMGNEPEPTILLSKATILPCESSMVAETAKETPTKKSKESVN